MIDKVKIKIVDRSKDSITVLLPGLDGKLTKNALTIEEFNNKFNLIEGDKDHCTVRVEVIETYKKANEIINRVVANTIILSVLESKKDGASVSKKMAILSQMTELTDEVAKILNITTYDALDLIALRRRDFINESIGAGIHFGSCHEDKMTPKQRYKNRKNKRNKETNKKVSDECKCSIGDMLKAKGWNKEK